MGDPSHLEDQRLAKRIKIFASPEVHHYSAEAKTFSDHHLRHHVLPLQAQLFPPQPTARLQQEQHFVGQACSVSSPSSAMATTMDPSGEYNDDIAWPSGSTTFDPYWTLSTSSAQHENPSSRLICPRESMDASALLCSVASPEQYAPSGDSAIGISPSSMQSAPCVDAGHTLQPDLPADTVYFNHAVSTSASFMSTASPALNASADKKAPMAVNMKHEHENIANRSAVKDKILESPFRDCVGTFGLQRSQSFHRPIDGQVNGYIKFSWPKENSTKRNSIVRISSISENSRITELDDGGEQVDEAASPRCVTSIGPHLPPTVRDNMADLNINFSSFVSQTASMGCGSHAPRGVTSSPFLPNDSVEIASMGAPRLIPSQYGYEAIMDNTDRRFWMFYIRNWCPGRSVLEETNLWLKDFAQMHKSVGVRSAIQSLAGIYIYDYQPLESIRTRVNTRFEVAERRFTELLNDPATYRDKAQADELITIAVILSMQDIVLTERRLKRPFTPRWLQGFRHGEELLQATDHGSRFWSTSNVQASSLRNSQSVIVGRAVILAQPMSSLPRSEEFDAQKEASRFGWLLYGTEKDMYQIHGGCGFSKKLLHIFSQVTYCAARLQQEAESPIVPMTADYILGELHSMRQWSPESRDWEAAKSEPPVIEWVRDQLPGYVIDSNSIMTDVTAEAWRIAAVLYLLCRVFRLPRNHPDVVRNLGDVARCISIMPTSGMQFTAQAPLLPVFLLGVLASVPEHKAVSSKWFDEVLQTPVRSSVPPLHAALKNIWSWIDTEFPLSLPPNMEAAQPIHLRHAWWEKLVNKVQAQEKEFLCLT